MNKNIIRRGDLYYAELKNIGGSVQEGTRPVVVIGNNAGNKYSPVLLVCPLTSRLGKTKLPTHVPITIGDRVSICLTEQILTIPKTSIKNFIWKVSKEELNEINTALAVSIGLKKF